MIYLDNAATSYPKPVVVKNAVINCIDNVAGNVSRSINDTISEAEDMVYDTRNKICNFFNFGKTSNVIFTYNITYALNIVIKGLIKKGDHILLSALEHNAVVRPVVQMGNIGIEYDFIPCDEKGNIYIDEIPHMIKKNTKAIICTHASNVSGTILPIDEIGKICKNNDLIFIVDSAQTAGLLSIDMIKSNIDVLCFTGHKGLMGIQGIGGFIITDKVANMIEPIVVGGTGSISDKMEFPNFLPDKFEAGTMNLPAIYGINSSIEFINSIGIENIYKHEMELTKYFLDSLDYKRIRLVGNLYDKRLGVISIDFVNIDNAFVADKLYSEYGISVRCGIHCAPIAHKTLKTFPKGTVRFSIGYFNTINDIEKTVMAIERICNEISI